MHSLDSLISVSKYQRGFSHFITGDRIAFSLTNSSFTELPSPDAMSFSVCEIIFRRFGGFEADS